MNFRGQLPELNRGAHEAVSLGCGIEYVMFTLKAFFGKCVKAHVLIMGIGIIFPGHFSP